MTHGRFWATYRTGRVTVGQAIRARLQLASSSWMFHLFVSLALIVLVFLHPPQVFSGDTDTARNYLNTIVSSLSTILALCISIILVAIQLTASNYTHRVLDFFVRLPYNVSLFMFYLVTIMHSFFLMAKIRDPVNDPLPVPLRPEMSADLVLVVICFLSLMVYMYAVVQLLKPERIIRLILRDCTRACQQAKWHAALDSVEQICDIAKRAASVNDSVTGLHCTEAMLYIASQLPIPRDRDDPLLAIHASVVDQWAEIVGISVKERETGLLHGAIDALFEQGCVYLTAQAWPAAELVIGACRQIVFGHLLTEGGTYYAERVASGLYQMAWHGGTRGERGRTFCLRTWQVVRAVGENVFTAQPTVVGTLVEGFLLPEHLNRTYELLSPTEREQATTIYFGLWKSFCIHASVRDAARWAAWWSGNVDASHLVHIGQTLSVLLAEHCQRPDIARTLSYIWRRQVTTSDAETAQTALGGGWQDVFDGWPLSSLRSL